MNDVLYPYAPSSEPRLGFTLVELLIAITVLAVIVVLTMPSFRSMLMNNRIATQADALYTGLNYARNIALTQNINVVACPFSAVDSTTCGGNWQTGWIIVSQPAAAPAVLLQSSIAGPNDPILSATAPSVTFDGRGIASTQANFKLCDNRGSAFALSIQVLPTGSVQMGHSAGLAVWDGSNLTCP